MKVLIWDYPFSLKNSGGPSGYLYNIREYLKENNLLNKDIFFLKDLINQPNIQSTKHEKYNKTLNYILKLDILKILPALNSYRRIRNHVKKFQSKTFRNINFNEFDAIHFHISFHIDTSKQILKNYKGKKIITTHSPQPLSEEFCTFPQRYNILNKYFLNKLSTKELNCWKQADYIMFPVKESVNVYFSNTKLKKYIENNSSKLCFCPTAINKKPIDPEKINIRKNLNIPDDAFILTYIGRHSVIKGYDQLVSIGEKIIDKYPNLHIVVAGNEYPLTGLKHSRWHEIGWINYSHSLIRQSDAFILPNKETYFDIVALEVLREGTPIIMSLTGGNRYFLQFQKKEREGIIFYEYENPNHIDDIIFELMVNKNQTNLSHLRMANTKLFNTYFSMQIYVENYKQLIGKLISYNN